MNRILETIYRLVDLVMIVMLVMMVGSIFINVVARYFGVAFSWVDEISRLTFVWMSFMAMVLAYRKGMHPSFNVVSEKLKGIPGKLLQTLINLLILIFLLYLLKGGIDYISRSHIQKTAILGISVMWKYLAVPCAMGMMVLEVVRNFYFVWKKE